MDSQLQTPAILSVKSRPLYAYLKHDIAFAMSAFVLGWLFFRAFFFSGACLGAFIFTAAAVAMGLLFIQLHKKLTVKSVILGAATLILSLPTVFSANYGMRQLASASAFTSYIIWITSAFDLVPKSDYGSAVSYISSVFFRPFSRFGDIFRASVTGMENGFGKKVLISILGLLTAVPLSFIVLINLAQADSRFNDLISESLNHVSDTAFSNIVSAILGILAAMYLFGLLSASRLSFVREREAKQVIPAGFTLSLTIPLMLCYVLFFAVQTPYYLSAFGGVLPEGYSFSEYAVSGFFELVRVAVINGMVCIGIMLFADGKTVRRITVTILGVMTLILLATAASKLFLYIKAYSLTLKRVYAGIALVFIAVFFVMMILRQYIDRLRFTASALIICALFSVTMTFPDWDGIIAGSLLRRVMDGSQSDLTAISELSNSPYATECLITAKNEGNWSVSKAAESILDSRLEMYKIHDSHSRTPLEIILEFNISEYRSREMIYEITDPTV